METGQIADSENIDERFVGLYPILLTCQHQHSSGLQCEVAYWPALAVGMTAQLATTHCPNDLKIGSCNRQLE